MAGLSRKQFLQAHFNNQEEDDYDADYDTELRRYHAENVANLVSFALSSLVLTKSFSLMSDIFAKGLN